MSEPGANFFAPLRKDCTEDCVVFLARWQEWWRSLRGTPIAILDCSPGYHRRLSAKSRNMVVKAERLYDYRPFDYNFHRDQVDLVNVSKRERQGKPMQGWYTEPAPYTNPWRLCGVHQDSWFGAFRRSDGGLAAYCHLAKVGDLAVINSILGHADAPAAVNGMISYLAHRGPHDGYGWLNYLRLSDDSLGAFKRRVGFEEALYA